ADGARAPRERAAYRVRVVDTDRRLRREVFTQADGARQVAEDAILRRDVVPLVRHRDGVLDVLRAAAGLVVVRRGLAGAERIAWRAGARDRLRRVHDHHVGEQTAEESAAALIRRVVVDDARGHQVQA